MATATKLQRAFGTIFAPDVIKRWDAEEDQRKAAETLSEIIGKPSEEAFQLFESDPAMTEGTGMHQGASPEMVTQLNQIQQMANSGNPMLQQKAMDQYDEFIAPPAYRAPEARTTSAKDYETAKAGGFVGSFFDYQKAIKKAGVAQDMSSTIPMSPKDMQGYRYKMEDGSTTPVTDTATSLNDIQNDTRLPPGAVDYVTGPTAQQEARIQKFSMAKDILARGREQLFGENGIMTGEDYKTDWKGQGAAAWKHLSQSDPRYNAYTSSTTGTISGIVKALGEAGALAEGDVARAMSLTPKLPVIDPFTGIYQKGDTPEVARLKYEFLEGLLNKWTNTQPTPEQAARELDEVFAKFEQSNESDQGGEGTIPIMIDGKIVHKKLSDL